MFSATLPQVPTVGTQQGADASAFMLTADASSTPQASVGPFLVGAAPRTYTITWAWNENRTFSDFNATADVLALDWFRGADLELTQQGGSAVLRIPSMQQSYTLAGVPLASLRLSNFTYKDASAGTYLAGVLGASAAPAPAQHRHRHRPPHRHRRMVPRRSS